MARSFPKKVRGRANLDQRPCILIDAEGHNVTETEYFRSFKKDHQGFSLIFVGTGSTDPQNMLDDVQDRWESEKLCTDKGDRAFIVLDLDCCEQKADQIKKLFGKIGYVTFIVSNPCFEAWFLMHYEYSTHPFANCKEVISQVSDKNHIVGYNKSMNVYPLIKDKLNVALSNSEKINLFYSSSGFLWPSNNCNPRTDVPELIKTLLEIEKSFKQIFSSVPQNKPIIVQRFLKNQKHHTNDWW